MGEKIKSTLILSGLVIGYFFVITIGLTFVWDLKFSWEILKFPLIATGFCVLLCAFVNLLFWEGE